MHLTWLDSNSWSIELGGQHILLDPWLVGSLMFGNAAWLFKSDRKTPRSIPENIDLILLSQGLEDHAHIPTLKRLDRQIPVVASPNAAKVVKELGYTQVTTLAHGETFTLPQQLEIKAVPGSPVGPTAVENGYILRDLVNGTSLYYEPHGYHSPTLKDSAPVDVVITPIIDLKVPLLGAVIKGQKGTLQVAQWLKPQVILPTAAGGDITFEGLLLKFLKAEGGAKEMRSLLAQNGMTTEVIEPTPWERFEVPLAQKSCI
ncbi:MBL fold metallo-hydrolase [Tumidithrix elongata RA019]|uniref:MBL fold metallo-hydrolase n=1 Tax=Tumidithrix elongata BACA0141 TaxID=2716417 RepID=A0AAW9PTW0_9CYAN|nr:MBL fold metallo-hydrolase [Tumidithrix elongata RA019]